IISDYQMPDMGGITFLKQLKASGNKTPFIIFTGRGREEVVIDALNNGADFYIQKGGEPKSQFAELSHKIKTAVSRQKTEKLAKETERRLYDIINFLPDATFAIDTDGTVIAWNKAIEEMTGVPAHEMIGRGNYEYAIPFYGERRPILINLVSIPDEELTRGKYAVIKKEGDILIAETTLPRPLGRYSVLLGKASLLFNDEGTAIGAIESIRDITEQKQVEEALGDSGRQLDAMATNIPGVVYRFCVNPDGTYGFDYIGERSRQILGLENDPFSFFDRVTEGIVPEERQRFISSVQHAINTKTLWEFDCWYVKPSGKKIWMSAVSSPVMENERLIFDGVIFDNTDRKRAEEELLKKNEELNASYEQIAAGEEELRANLDNITRQDLALSENEEKYRTVIEQSHDGIIIAQDGILVFHNPSFASLTGYSSEELKHRSIADLIAPEDRELVLTRHRERQLGKTLPEVYEFSVLHHDGTSRIRVSMNITSASIGGRPATIGTLHNITEERRREDALRESEEKLRLKLDSVLSPDVDLDEQDLANIIDTALIQSLMDDFFAVTGMPIGIVDLKGNVLVKTGWQDICNKFHRVHPETLKNCIESNLILSSGVPKGESRAYRCRNNMWDIVTPIFIGDKHIGNLFCGQFFYDDEVKNPQVFIDQAEKYGFDKDKYLAALNSVPRWSREKIKNTMQFYAKFAEMVSKLSYSNLKLAKMISTQKQVEASLMEQEEQSRMLLSSMPDIVMVHHDGIIVYANQMALEKTGFSKEELIGSHLFDRVKETDREIILRNMKKRAAGEPVGEYEIDMIHKSGLLHHVIIRASPIMFNQLPSIVFIIIDITERKKAEDVLRESEEKYRLIFENSPLGHLSFDEKGVIVACNDKFIQIIGSSREALVGLNMLNLPDKNIVSAVKKALSGYNGLYEGVYSSVTAKKITPVRGLFAPMNFGEGRIPGGMG
ncbi:MAG: PAS domain S-box protein, partial [Methanomicrobiales archaeon]